MSDSDQPSPPVLDTPLGKTVCNYVSFNRNQHGLAFLVYGLILISVIVAVWLGQNGTITLFNAAVWVTVVISLLILFTFIHWYWFMKGVIPGSAKWGGFGISTSVTTKTNTSTSATTAGRYNKI